MTLRGQAAVVTGGGSGIGRSTALALTAQGCRVLIVGRSREKLLEVAGSAPSGADLLLHPLDVGDRKAVQTAFAWAVEQLGQIDILINCAGMNIAKRTMAEMPPEQWDEVLRINTTGAYNCMLAALPGMRERKSGLIINISSVAGKRATRLGGVAYNASKFAMTALGTSVGLEEGPNGIRVTNIYPGEVDTPILEARPTPVTAEHRARILRPEDVAAVALFVATSPRHVHLPEIVVTPAGQEYF